MELLFQFQLSLYAIIASLVLLFKIYHSGEVYSYSSRLFRTLLVGTVLISVLELLSWAFDGTPGVMNHVLNYMFNYLLFALSIVAPGFWASYIYYKIYGDITRIRKAMFFQYPTFLAFLFVTINIFYPIVFKIPADTNVYERLPFVAFNFVMVYILVAYTVFLTIKEHRKIKTSVITTVLIFVTLTLGASILQLFNFGLIIMYPMMVLSLIVVYLFLETSSASIDYLTEAYSRIRFDEFVASQIDRNEEFCVVMLDLDDYKVFNDVHGHIVGDRILIQYVKSVKQAFGKGSFVARYGGDEFVVVVLGIDRERLMKMNGQLKDSIRHSKDQLFAQLRYSMGYSCRTEENQFAYDKLLIEADKVMYENKAINKNFKRRKEDRNR